jgi:glycosyltransferase involved in cell wall biosynthesis
MHICYLSELFYPYLIGGAERRYFEIAKRLAKKHDVTVYSLRLQGSEDYEVYEGIEIKRVGLRHPMGKRSLLPLISYKPFLEALRSDYDIIDANQGIASFMGAFSPLTKRPIVATFHDIYWRQWNQFFPKPYAWFGKFMEFAWSRLQYDRVIANSPPTADKLRRLGFSNIKTIVSGIDLRMIDSIKAKKEDRVIYVGRLIKYKHVDELIKSMKGVDAKLTIVGSGPDEAALKKLAKETGIDAEFLGYVSEKEKIKLMKSSKILVNPSSVEGLGLILAEAMACGTAVVARPLPSYFFCNAKNSLMTENFAGSINGLLDNDSRRNELVKNALKTSREFDWDKTASQVEEVYEELK